MTIIQVTALLLIIIIIVAVIVYGISLTQKVKTDTDKVFISRFLIILIITFVAGGITRTIQQNTGIEWLNGLVPIFGGLHLSLWSAPIFWRISSRKERGIKTFLLFLLGLLFALPGFGFILLGITQIWKSIL